MTETIPFPDVVAYAVPGFILLIAAEMFAVRFGARGDYETRDTFASLAMGALSQLSGLLGTGFAAFAVYAFLYDHRLFDIPITAGTLVLAFVLDDLVYYWAHRIYHERRWFWADHVIHHSSQHYNLSTALRQGWSGKLAGSFIFRTPLVVLGFPPEALAFVFGINLVYQFWIHTEVVDRLGPLEWIFNTPSHHRVHHATNPDYLDANYAGVFIIWDRLFGTFVSERRDEPPRYGVVRNLGTFNPLAIATHEYRSIFRDLRGARSAREIAGYLFGPPGWSPDGSRSTSADIKRRARSTSPASIDASASGAAPAPAE